MIADDHPQPPQTTTQQDWSGRLRRPVRLVGLALVVAALALLAGWTGLLIGLGVVGIGVVAPAPVAFGVGGASLLVGSAGDPFVYALGTVGLMAVLVDPAVGAPTGRRVLAATAGGGIVIATVTYGLLTVWSLPAVTVVVSGTVVLMMYALHRYERVMLGLVSDSPNQ
ncbi:hypothetical protein DJ73_06125 [Halorubrum sp. Ea1]|uniref:hypothetical protein n=1 Tax=Halorubrum sp. Ea1 TaxID=1480718 RepID=UPI000B9803BE|nr:hypothetical protein [Halorubrum sp. Ea1]OYR53877.1 hypothetical protein DJ73_06125 [Halorubrum sp. Ea1]